MAERVVIEGLAAKLMQESGELLYQQPGHKVVRIADNASLRLGVFDNDTQTLELLDGPALLAAIVESRAAPKRRLQDIVDPPSRL